MFIQGLCFPIAEQQHSMVANNRVKEAKNELLAERSKFATMEKRYQEKVAQQASELEAMQQRMRHAHEQHIVEIGDMRGRLQQLVLYSTSKS